jgi:hypothetical protein
MFFPGIAWYAVVEERASIGTRQCCDHAWRLPELACSGRPPQ